MQTCRRLLGAGFLSVGMATLVIACAPALVSDTSYVFDTGIPYYLPKSQVRLDLIVEAPKPTPKPGGGGAGVLAAAPQPSPSPSAAAEPAKAAPPPAAFVWEIEGFKISLDLSTERIPDRTKLYFLRKRADLLSDDQFKLSVNAKGLLSASHAVTEDKTAESITELGKVAVAVARGMAGGGVSMPSFEALGMHIHPTLGIPVPTPTPTVDPRARVREALQSAVGRHRILREGPNQKDNECRPLAPRSTGNPPPFATPTPPAKELEAWHSWSISETGARFGVAMTVETVMPEYDGASLYNCSGRVTDQQGVHVRVPVPERLTVRLGVCAPDRRETCALQNEGAIILGEVEYGLLMPDCSPEFVIPIRRTWFAKNDQSIVLEDGSPRDVTVNATSPVVAIARIPRNILEGASDLIEKVMPLRFGGAAGAIDQAAKEEDLRTKQLDNLKKQLDNEELQKKIAAMPTPAQ